MAAYAAYELQRKREEERREKGRAEAEWDRASAKKKETEQGHTSNVYAQLRNQQAEKERTSQTYAQLRAQAAQKERQKVNDDFRKGERAPENVNVPQPKSWLENAWDNTRNFVQEKIVQPFDKYIYQPLIKPVVEKVTQTAQIIWNNTKTFVQEKVGPIIQKALTPSSLLKAAITTTMVATTSVALQCCGGKCGGTPTPDVSALSTQAVQTVMARFQLTQAAQAYTPTPRSTPTSSVTADSLNSSVHLYQLAAYLYSNGVSECALDKQNSPECLVKLTEWQNKYNQTILDAANDPESVWRKRYHDINPAILAVIYKRVVLNESQFVPGWVTGSEQGTGFAQITPDTLNSLINNGLVSLPRKDYPRDPASLVAILQDPAFNAKAGMANLIYLYQGISYKNKQHDWQMSQEDTWKLVAALYNAGAQGPGVYGTPDPLGQDFWEANRIVVQNDPNWNATYGCNNPNSWSCLQYMFPNKDAYGRCTVAYAESVAPDGITNNPASPDVLNVQPYNPQECKP